MRTFVAMKLHIFNPEHDLALAACQRRFTAPHAGRQLRSDLAFIPALWADKGDFVLVDDIDDAEDKVRHLGSIYIDKVEFITRAQLQKLMGETMLIDCIHPWGWDLALKGELERLDTPSIMLPSDDTLEQIRLVSSRQWAAAHLQKNVVYVTKIEQVRQLTEQQGRVVVKAPWSSSGRGVRYIAAEEFSLRAEHASHLRWIENVIERQGGVTVERYYNKVKDFGMEFVILGGRVEYCGLSLFDTIKNAYSGNLLASEEEKVEILRPYVDASQLEDIRQQLIAKLEPALRGIYQGPFGVDMMICSGYADGLIPSCASSAGDFSINPCVELNLRRTMGHVALSLAHCSADRNRIMRIEYDGGRYHLRVMPGHPSEDAPLH